MQNNAGASLLPAHPVLMASVFFRGAAGSGKTYASRVAQAWLAARFPGRAVGEVAFADALKLAAAELLQWPASMARADDSKPLPVSHAWAADAVLARAATHLAGPLPQDAVVAGLRAGLDALFSIDPDDRNLYVLGDITYGRFLQLLGTEVARAHVHDEIWPAVAYAAAVQRGLGGVVYPDTRFPQEVALCTAVGGAIARVVRTDGARSADGRSAAHASERALDGVPCAALENDGTPAFDAVVTAWLEAQFGAN
jgi:hypothetical protein